MEIAEFLDGYDVECCTLGDLGITTEPDETGRNPEENAIIKAKYYGPFFDVVSCNNSGLYFVDKGDNEVDTSEENIMLAGYRERSVRF